ncbi:hypothetical protein FACS1894172_09690 [Spirochaetia bacterium]|nr:hypothetical protein FACS1894164_00640 [Spirochaetia bacterium]GHU32661.1 hypothetical protein FACS1894172_09690 [Spirochaetia bacterium]
MCIKRNISIPMIVVPAAVFIAGMVYTFIKKEIPMYIFWIINEIVWCVIFFRGRLKRDNVLYDTTDDGFFMRGAKEKYFDPDFISYKDLQDIKMLYNKVSLILTDGRVVNMVELGKYKTEIYNDIKGKIPGSV